MDVVLGFIKAQSNITIVVIFAVQAIIVAFIRSKSSLSVNNLRDQNEIEHKEIVEKLETLYSYFEIGKETKFYIDKLFANRDHLIEKIHNKVLKNFLYERSLIYINTIKSIAETYSISVDNLSAIETALSSTQEKTLDLYYHYFTPEFIYEYITTKHNSLVDCYLKKMRFIVMDLENHHKERFLKLANNFLVDSINELGDYDSVIEVHVIHNKGGN